MRLIVFGDVLPVCFLQFLKQICMFFNLRIIFLLLRFCFKNLASLDRQTTQFDFSLSTFFVNFTSCGLKLHGLKIKSLHSKQYVVQSPFPVFIGFIFDFAFFIFYNVGSIFLKKYLVCFNGLEMLDA